MGKKKIQIETGFLYVKNENDFIKRKSTTYNSTLLRYGLLKNFELRFGFEYINHNIDNKINKKEIINTGWAPLKVGAKIGISEENGIIPALGLVGGLTIPKTGHGDYRIDFWAPMFRLAGSYTISETFGFGFNFGSEWDGFDPNAIGIYSGVIGASFGKLGLFAELYGYLTQNRMPDHRADGGLTFMVRDNFQLDFSGGFGISEISPDYFASFGFSWRLPN